jgi:hypothetical protein
MRVVMEHYQSTFVFPIFVYDCTSDRAFVIGEQFSSPTGTPDSRTSGILMLTDPRPSSRDTREVGREYLKLDWPKN